MSEAEGRKVNLRQGKVDFKRDNQHKYGESSKYDNRVDRRNERGGGSDSKHDRRDERYHQKDIKSNRRSDEHGSAMGRDDRKYPDRRHDLDKSYKRQVFDDSQDSKRKINFARPDKDTHSSSGSSRSSGGSHSQSEYNLYSHHFEAKSKLGFRKPEENNSELVSDQRYSINSSGRKSWQKKDVTSKQEGMVDEQSNRSRIYKSKSPPSRKSKSRSPSNSSKAESEDEERNPPEKQPEILSDQQLNELAAKLVKAEILGNDELAAQLKKKLETARQVRADNPNAVATSSKIRKSDAEVVVLSRTDSRGFARPLETKSAHPEPVGGRRKKQNVETHSSDGQRVRYFPDDDKYSLKDMFQREKLTTAEDQNEMFTKLAGKDGRQEHDYDMDDIFSERARQKESDGKMEARERGRAIQEHKRKERVLDSCKWCFDGKELQRHLIVAVGSKAYVCLPPYQSLTEGHCLIIPLHHNTCATQLDEDVWEEIQVKPHFSNSIQFSQSLLLKISLLTS